MKKYQNMPTLGVKSDKKMLYVCVCRLFSLDCNYILLKNTLT